MVWARYAARQRDPFIARETVAGIGSIDYIADPKDDAALSPDVLGLLAYYRVPAAQ